MQNYLELVQDILDNGEPTMDRTGVGTIKVFDRNLSFDLGKGFPILTTKKIHFKSVVAELLWFLRGSTDVAYLIENGCTIWNEWVTPETAQYDDSGKLISGSVGPMYGKQWRDFGGVDQIKQLIEGLKFNPNSRRHVVASWNPPEIFDMALPPCHPFFQFVVTGNKLNCKFTMRSSDVFLGLPFNIASYALLTHILAKLTGYEVGTLAYSGGDVHIYINHVEQCKLQLTRIPKTLPTLWMADFKDIDTLKVSDFMLMDYMSHPSISAPIAV